MGSAMSIGLMMGGLNAAGALLGSANQNASMKAQADAAKRQAANYEIQAKEAADRGRIEAAQIDQRKSELRKRHDENEARNKTLLGVGNVDMASGSAMDVAKGNAENFAADIGDNAYSRILKEWETDRNKERLQAAADQSRAQADVYAKQSRQWAPGLLGAVLSGASGFASGYGMAGGSLKSLWGGAAANPSYDPEGIMSKTVKAFHEAGKKTR